MSSQSASLLSFHFPGNLNVSLRGDADGDQKNSTWCSFFSCMEHTQHTATGVLLKVSLEITKLTAVLAPRGNRERVMDEKWVLCKGASCPRSEPLLFTGSPLIPVRELSAAELIWAAFPFLLWLGRADPFTAQCTHFHSLTHSVTYCFSGSVSVTLHFSVAFFLLGSSPFFSLSHTVFSPSVYSSVKAQICNFFIFVYPI